jgi:hypothetical protein
VEAISHQPDGLISNWKHDEIRIMGNQYERATDEKWQILKSSQLQGE